MYLYPDYDTFEIFPWRPQQGKVARLICDVYTPDGRRSSSVLILLHVWIQRFSKLSLIICISSIPLAMRSFSNCINVFVSFNDSIILLVLATFSGTLSDILTSSASSTALNPLSRSISLDLFLLNSSTFLYSNLVIEAYSL